MGVKRNLLAVVGAWGVHQKQFGIRFEIVRFDAMLIQMRYALFIFCLAQNAF